MRITSQHIASLLEDIRFWILILFCIRLIGISYAPIEVHHNWRQTTVTMVARNFYEGEANPYTPQLDFGGSTTGISAMEFPVLNYLIYLFSLLFGYDHWYGRLINLVITSIGLWYFHQLIAGIFNARRAFVSTLLLGSSLWFIFGRKIMPDTMAVSFVIMSMYLAWLYLSHERTHLFYACGAGLLFALGALSKLPAALPMILFPFILLRWGHASKKMLLTSVYLLCAILVVHWYWIWTPYLTETYGMHHFFMGKSLATGSQEIADHMGSSLERIFIGPFKYIGGVAFLSACVWSLYRKEKTLLCVLGSTAFALIALMCKSGETFYAHDYYILPFVPTMALLIAYFMEQLPSRIAMLCITAIVLESLLNQTHDLRWKPSYDAYMDLETLMDQFTPREALVAINCAPNPSTMYFAHRKGWLCTNAELADHNQLRVLQDQGLQYILICKDRFGRDLELPSQSLLFENDRFRLYQLQPTESSFGIAALDKH